MAKVFQFTPSAMEVAFDTIPSLAWSTAADGSQKTFNKQWYDYTGLSPSDGLAAGWGFTFHPDDAEKVTEQGRQLLASGQPGELKARIRRHDGEYRWFLLRANPLRDEAGNILKWYGIHTDIEDLKRAEALLAGEKKLLEMIAQGESLTTILNTLCLVVEELSGKVLASVLLLDQDSKCLRHCAAPSLPADFAAAVDKVLIGPSVGSCGTAAFRGEKVYVSDIATDPLWAEHQDFALAHGLAACWSTPIKSAGGGVWGTFAMYSRQPREITPHEEEIMEQFTHLARIVIERKRAEDALLKSEAFLAEGQRISHTGSWTWNVTSGKVFWSDEHYRIFGYERDQKEPKFPSSLRSVHPDDRKRVYQALHDAVEDKRDFSVDFRAVLADGTERHLSAVGRSIAGASGLVGDFIGTTVDVTEARRAQDELFQKETSLQQTQAELAHVMRMTTMDELAASIAHEINQPLGSIANNASACLRLLPANCPDDLRAGLSEIVKDALGASAIISRIRAMTKGAPPEMTSLRVQDVVADVLALSNGQLAENRILVETHLPLDLPEVRGDRVGLQQVLLNLIANAVEAMAEVPDERRLIRIRGSRGERNGLPVVVVSVEDAGIGLAPGDEDRIFEAFHTSKPKGMGMGLRISRTIIESYGGRLWAGANFGPGATFSLYLPAYRPGARSPEFVI